MLYTLFTKLGKLCCCIYWICMKVIHRAKNADNMLHVGYVSKYLDEIFLSFIPY